MKARKWIMLCVVDLTSEYLHSALSTTIPPTDRLSASCTVIGVNRVTTSSDWMDFALLEMDYVKFGLSRGHARSLNLSDNRQPSATSTTLFPTSLLVQPNVLLPNTIRTIRSSWFTFLMRELVLNEWRRPIIFWPSFELMLSSMSLSTSSLLSLPFLHCYSSHYAVSWDLRRDRASNHFRSIEIGEKASCDARVVFYVVVVVRWCTGSGIIWSVSRSMARMAFC